jgi:outer membrane immunogenic protein
MRSLLMAVALLSCVALSSKPAAAADYDMPTLRGSDSFAPARDFCCSRWGGFYFGGQLGTGFSSVDFSDSTQGLVAHMLRETALENNVQPSTWSSLGKIEKTGSSYGAFGGYNSRWESLILGLELNYSHSPDLHATAPVSVLERVTAAGGNTYDLTLTANAFLNIKDLLTLRARAGWEAANFLPYVMLGVAAVRADVFHSATAFGFQNPPPVTSPPTPCGPPQTPTCLPFSFTEVEARNGAFLWGWSIGGGIDVMVMPHVFLRAEAEFVGLAPWWHIRPTITTGRVGLGYKF